MKVITEDTPKNMAKKNKNDFIVHTDNSEFSIYEIFLRKKQRQAMLTEEEDIDRKFNKIRLSKQILRYL